MAGTDVTAGQLLLAEYECVKDEQKARIGFRDNLLYVTLAVVAAVIAAAAQAKQASMLLGLPPVCVVLGWTYLVNDEKISAIGAYVRGELAPRLAALTGEAGAQAFGWETFHRGDARRVSRKVVQCVVDLVAFCVVPLGALVVYWTGRHLAAGLLAVSVIEALAVVGLAAYVVMYALPFGSGSSSGSGAAAGAGTTPGSATPAAGAAPGATATTGATTGAGADPV